MPPLSAFPPGNLPLVTLPGCSWLAKILVGRPSFFVMQHYVLADVRELRESDIRPAFETYQQRTSCTIPQEGFYKAGVWCFARASSPQWDEHHALPFCQSADWTYYWWTMWQPVSAMRYTAATIAPGGDERRAVRMARQGSGSQ